MQIYKSLLLELMESGRLAASDICDVIHSRCFKALEEISSIVSDDLLDDVACFERIEKIIKCLEKNDITSGLRHDFG